MSNYLGFMPVASGEYYFVSYNNEDAGRVSGTALMMHQAGIPLWYDYGIDYGKKWNVTINRKIAGAKGIIIFFSRGVLQKEGSYVYREYLIAQMMKRRSSSSSWIKS